MHARARFGWVSFIVLFPLLTHAVCPDHQAVTAYVADFQAARVSQGCGNDLSLADAECARDQLVQELPQVLGRVLGYKAGFTHPALHQRFGVSSPAWGVMFAKQMVESGATLPAPFGARPLYEADFIAVVKDAGLADARTPRRRCSTLPRWPRPSNDRISCSKARHQAPHSSPPISRFVGGLRPPRHGRAHPGIP